MPTRFPVNRYPRPGNSRDIGELFHLLRRYRLVGSPLTAAERVRTDFERLFDCT